MPEGTVCVGSAALESDLVQERDDAEYQTDSSCSLRNPEAKQATRQTRLELRQALLELRVSSRKADLHLGPELRDPARELGSQFGNSLLELRIKPGEVLFVCLPEFGSIRSIHSVEPLHEPCPERSEGSAEFLLELARQLGGDRHMSSW